MAITAVGATIRVQPAEAAEATGMSELLLAATEALLAATEVLLEATEVLLAVTEVAATTVDPLDTLVWTVMSGLSRTGFIPQLRATLVWNVNCTE